MEWRISPWVETMTMVPEDAAYANPGKVIDDFVYWTYPNGPGMLMLNMATSQFCRMDVPPLLKEARVFFKLGQTKDGKLCLVHSNGNALHNRQHKLFVWLWGKDDEGVERWTLDKLFPLRTIAEFINCSMLYHAKARIIAVIDGSVYLSVDYMKDSNYPEWFLSFCLETAELHQLFKGQYQTHLLVHPYVMPWPASLVNSKECSEAEVSRNCGADNGPMATKEPSSILITALQSSKQALINDAAANITETEAFFSIEDDKSSLISKIATLDARLKNARDHVLRLSADSAKCHKPCADEQGLHGGKAAATYEVNQECSEAEVTRNCAADDGPVATKEPSSMLITALQSFKEALINDDAANITETAAFFSIEDDKSSLVSKITTLVMKLQLVEHYISRRMLNS